MLSPNRLWNGLPHCIARVSTVTNIFHTYITRCESDIHSRQECHQTNIWEVVVTISSINTLWYCWCLKIYSFSETLVRPPFLNNLELYPPTTGFSWNHFSKTRLPGYSRTNNNLWQQISVAAVKYLCSGWWAESYAPVVAAHRAVSIKISSHGPLFTSV